MSDEHWRIDELAHRSGVSVDTIRFYQRDGLLPPGHRQGRATIYGPSHLRRIEQIRDLQARHFNLAAVKALLAESRLGAVQAMFSADETSLSREELVARAQLPEALVKRIEDAGLLLDPATAGRTGFDQADADLLRAVARLLELGMPEEVVVFMARLYAEHFGAMQAEVAAVFQGQSDLDWPEAERARFVDQLGDRVAEVSELTGRLLDYAHHTTVRRMTLATPLSDDDQGLGAR